MNKQKVLQSIDLVAYLAIINATIFAIIFQYTASIETIKVSLFSFIVGFALSFLFCLLRFIFSYKNKNDENYQLTKKRKIILAIKTCLSLLMLIFSIVILVLI